MTRALHARFAFNLENARTGGDVDVPRAANRRAPVTSWENRTRDIGIGDTVCYSRTFLRSTCQLTGEIPHARGVVKGIVSLGSTTLAEIDWGSPEIPSRVNIANLSKVTDKGIAESL